MEQALTNNLIFKRMLGFLEKEDLFETSSVSKYWNFWSREVLREKYCLTAKPQTSGTLPACTWFPNDGNSLSEFENWHYLKTYSSPCGFLQQLNNFLENSVNVPFVGLTIYVVEGQDHKCIPDECTSKLICNILNKIKVKVLDIGWDPDSKCVISSKCLSEIWKSTSASLERLRVRLIYHELNSPRFDNWASLFPEFISTKSVGLPNLQRLDVSSYFNYYGRGNGFSNKIRELVQAAPRLLTLEGNICSSCSRLILEQDLSRFIQDFVYTLLLWEFRTEDIPNVLSFAQKSPKLKKLKLQISNCIDDILSSDQPERVSKITTTLELLFHSSRTTLRHLRIYCVELLWLFKNCNFPELSGLKSLALICSESVEEFRFDRLTTINWGRYFPKLVQFAIIKDFGIGHLRSQNTENDDFARNSPPFVCETVTSLIFRLYTTQTESETFKTIFPNVKELRFNGGLFNPVKLVGKQCELWSAWEDLEFLSVIDHANSDIADGALLGISLEEVKYLKENIRNFDSLEIVSSKPGLSNLKKLKTLSIRFDHNCAQPNSDMFIFSPLVLNLEFKRLPDLKVLLRMCRCDRDDSGVDDNCDFQLDRLQPLPHFVKSLKMTQHYENMRLSV